jgi:hypothetical protein
MERFKRTGTAIVIEPRADLAQAVCDLLSGFGYEPISAPTHAEAAARAELAGVVQLLTATVPAPDEIRSGIYLREAMERNPRLAIVLMLSDHLEQPEDAPERSEKVVKPFGREALAAAIERSEIKVRALV